MQSLEGRTVIVAGGSGGIGSEISRILARAKASVVIADLNRQLAEALAAELVSQGHSASALEVDVTSDESVLELFTKTIKQRGSLYGLINSIGVVGVGTALECPIDEYQRQLSVNCFGAMRLARSFVKSICAHTSSSNFAPSEVMGSLVYISSIAADLAIPERDPYCVSKAAGQIFHLNLANECAQFGINVNVVLPGRTDTPSAAERARSSEAAATSMFATQRRAAMIPSLTIARAAVFLLSPDLVGCSGQKFTVAEGADTTYRPSYEALVRAQHK